MPLFWLVLMAFKGENAIINGPRYLPFVDFTPSLDAWKRVLSNADGNLARRLLNSLVVSFSASAIAVLFGAMACYGFTRFPRSRAFISNRSILALILFTRLLPPIALVLPLYVMAQVTAILDSRATLIAVYAAINIPVSVWLLGPVLGARATETEEAAILDGASHRLIFFTILAPTVAGGLAAVALLIFVFCWNEYLISAFLASESAVTLPSWMAGYIFGREAQVGSDTDEWANLSAAIIVMVLPVLMITSLAWKWLHNLPWGATGAATLRR